MTARLARVRRVPGVTTRSAMYAETYATHWLYLSGVTRELGRQIPV